MNLNNEIIAVVEKFRKAGDIFHAHLNVCPQCEKHPFDLCPVGKKILDDSVRE